MITRMLIVVGRIPSKIRKHGLAGICRLAVMRLRVGWRGLRGRGGRFDRQSGVQTEGIMEVDSLDIPFSARDHSVRYDPTAVECFNRIMAGLRIRHEDFTFVDIGSGKGRVILMASEYPFRRILGVELSPALHRIAADNIRAYNSESQRCKDITSTCSCATTWEIPEEDLVLFMFNPFDGTVLSQFLATIRESMQARPRALAVVYVYPRQEHLLADCGFLRRIGGERGYDPYTEYAVYANDIFLHRQ